MLNISVRTDNRLAGLGKQVRNMGPITSADLLAAGEILRANILKRTAAGVDYLGQAFQGYSTRGPYYFYPVSGGVGRRRSITARMRSAARMKRLARGGVRTRMGIKFQSYGDAKRAYGRGNVDLFGLQNHPHMMNAIKVKASSSLLSLGFYGEEVARAVAHNEGKAHNPRRRFFDASPKDIQQMAAAINARRTARGGL